MRLDELSEFENNGRISGEPATPSEREVRELAMQLRSGVVPPESAFDRYLSADLQARSGRHWTPLHVVSRAVRWLDSIGVRTVVDVGSGVGKFCVLAGLAGTQTYLGIEERPGLVAVADRLARAFGVRDRVRFETGVFGRTALPAADVYYFFNPFAEGIFEPASHVAADRERSLARYRFEVRAAASFLRSLPPGAHVLTYHGFGGRMPRSFDEVCVDSRIPALLRLWRKTDR